MGITPAAGYVSPPAALAIGVTCALLSYGAMQLRARTRVDDSLDVCACHGVAGIGGALLTGVFASRLANPAGADGLLHGNPGLLGSQAIAVLAAIVFAATATLAILWLVRLTLGVRADVRDEITGLDMAEHGEEAYFGGELGSLAGPGVTLGGSVVLSQPTAESAPRPEPAGA